MLPQFGLTEFLLIATVALIVVGPKDLPLMMRKLGQFVAKGKAMAREFQAAFDDIAKQAELDELRKEIEDLRRENALTQAVDDLKKTEADINRQVMMESPLPASNAEPEPSANSDETKDAPADKAGPKEPEAGSSEAEPEPETAPKAAKS
ncbi:MAG: Sec-independent protein translocase protein TatB [Henriciella sp.]|uniref:Sec-independent protein translocase protein TatB n=1 Tax=Henriciella sp. TaxID=1968823 RepID=UPI003C756E5C